jgi:hypothetical protein
MRAFTLDILGTQPALQDEVPESSAGENDAERIELLERAVPTSTAKLADLQIATSCARGPEERHPAPVAPAEKTKAERRPVLSLGGAPPIGSPNP